MKIFQIWDGVSIKKRYKSLIGFNPCGLSNTTLEAEDSGCALILMRHFKDTILWFQMLVLIQKLVILVVIKF